MNTFSKNLGTLLIIPILFITYSFQKKGITEKEAIRLAENFIKRNGYTSSPVDTSQYKLSFGLNDYGTIRAILKQRHNRLNPHAYCIAKSDKYWNIGFIVKNAHISPSDTLTDNLPASVVIVSESGTEIRMAHKTALFSHFRKL